MPQDPVRGSQGLAGGFSYGGEGTPLSFDCHVLRGRGAEVCSMPEAGSKLLSSQSYSSLIFSIDSTTSFSKAWERAACGTQD